MFPREKSRFDGVMMDGKRIEARRLLVGIIIISNRHVLEAQLQINHNSFTKSAQHFVRVRSADHTFSTRMIF